VLECIDGSLAVTRKINEIKRNKERNKKMGSEKCKALLMKGKRMGETCQKRAKIYGYCTQHSKSKTIIDRLTKNYEDRMNSPMVRELDEDLDECIDKQPEINPPNRASPSETRSRGLDPEVSIPTGKEIIMGKLGLTDEPGVEILDPVVNKEGLFVITLTPMQYNNMKGILSTMYNSRTYSRKYEAQRTGRSEARMRKKYILLSDKYIVE
jgi:hypothetical protein